jgi:lipopolysaccharide/colanic/teichoic acid biosynthesis glycosyltransferase
VLLAKVPRDGSAIRKLRAHHRSRVHFNLDARDRVRRIADLFIGFGLLGLTGPLMLLVVIALRSESHSAVFERQNCIAAGGRRFQMLKFRTRRDPDRAPPGLEDNSTALGVFLRFTRIEALPTLINVLRGDVSMIDPERRSPSFLD